MKTISIPKCSFSHKSYNHLNEAYIYYLKYRILRKTLVTITGTDYNKTI